MALAEKGVAYTLQACGPDSPEILAVHPFGHIPALRVGDIGIRETAAILNYTTNASAPATRCGRARSWNAPATCSGSAPSR